MIKNYLFICLMLSFVGLQGFSESSSGVTTEGVIGLNYIAPPCDTIGESCDDGDPNTVNDRVGPDCLCAGEPIATSCDDVEVTYQVNGGLIETGAIINVNETDSIELFANLSDYEVRDPNGNVVPNNSINGITSAQAGNYTLTSKFPIQTTTTAPIIQEFSSESSDGPAINAIDNDPSTFWHSQWSGTNIPNYPDHYMIFDMGEGSMLSGLTYQHRQDVNNGRIRGYQIYLSNSLGDWGLPITGNFEATLDQQIVTFPPVQARYLRFVPTSPQTAGQVWATAARLYPIRLPAVTATASSFHSSPSHPASLAVDGNNSTFWHSRYDESVPGPHYITLDLGIESNVTQLTYRTRPSGPGSGNQNGNILNYTILSSNSMEEWPTEGQSGTWGGVSGTDYTVTLNPPLTARYIRLRADTWLTDDNGSYASAAEVSVTRPTVNVPCVKTITLNVNPRKTFAYNNGVWSPELPVAGPTSNDILIINEGDAVFDTPFNVERVIVNPNASLTIDTGVTLNSNTTVLKSQSNNYSSLIVDGVINGLVIYERWVNQIGSAAGGGNDLIASPVSGAFFDNAFRVANLDIIPENPDPGKKGEFAFAPYNVEVGAYENIDIGAEYTGATLIEPGVGYRAATNAVSPQSGNNLIFTGGAEKGIVNVTLSDAAPGRAWNLIGNPYPSYLNFDAFFNANKDEFRADVPYQAVYGYTGASGQWHIINLANSDEYPYIAPGQGFFVKSKSPSGSVQFTLAMRSPVGADDYIAGRPNNGSKVHSKLKLSSDSNESFTSIYFIEGSTKGLDAGYDAAVYSATEVDFSLYTQLLEDNAGLEIGIQSLPFDDFNDVVVPLGIKAKADTELTISIDELSTLSPNINVYLEDTKTKTLTLLNNGDFKYTPTTDVNGSGRFNVHYSSRTLSIDDIESNDNLRIFTTASPKSLYIVGQLTNSTIAYLYDIQGRRVLSKVLNANSTENTMDISTLSPGVYVVKINNDHQIKTQRVIIK